MEINENLAQAEVSTGDFACAGMLFHRSSKNLKSTKRGSSELFNTEVLLRESQILVQGPVEGDVCTVRDTDLNPPQAPALLSFHLGIFLLISPS